MKFAEESNDKNLLSFTSGGVCSMISYADLDGIVF